MRIIISIHNKYIKYIRRNQFVKHCFIFCMGILFPAMLPSVAGANSLQTDNRFWETEYTLVGYNRNKQYIQQQRKEKKQPEHRLNSMEGDLCFRRGLYFEALKFYKRAMYDKNVTDSIDFIQSMEFRQILCYDRINNISLLSVLVDQLYETSYKTDNKTFLAVAQFFKGKINYYQGKKNEGYRQMDKGIQLMRLVEDDRNKSLIMFFFLEYFKFLQKEYKPKSALKILQAMDELLKEKPSSQSSLLFSEDVWMKEYYAYYAVTLYRLGREEEAHDYYNKYLAMGDVFSCDYDCIKPYMFGLQLYDDIIRFGEVRLSRLQETGDLLNYNSMAVYRLLAEAYELTGDYKKSISCYQKLNELHDEFSKMAELSAMEELSANYTSYEEQLMSMQKGHNDTMKYFYLIAGIVVSAIILFVWQSLRYNKAIRRKNVSLAKTINELVSAKSNLYQEAYLHKTQDSSLKNGQEEDETQKDNEDTKTEKPNMSELMERRRFERMNRGIVEQKLYLNPHLSRTMLLEKYKIPKNVFSQLFQKYLSKSYSTYINDLRLDYAAKQLIEFPNYTVESIAEECGISSVGTLYRLFSKKYGMTPSEYRFFATQTVDDSPFEE